MNLSTFDFKPGKDFVVHVDRNLRIKHIDESLGEIVKAPLDGLIGHTWYEAFTDLEEIPEDCPISRALKSGKWSEGEVRYRDNGTLKLRCYPVHGNGKKANGAIVVSSLPMDSMNIGPADALLAQAISSDFPLAVTIVDPETLRIVDCNETALKRLGYTKEKLLKISVLELPHQKSGDEVRNEVKQVLEDGSKTITVDAKMKSGEIRTAFAHLAKITVEGKTLIRTISHDIPSMAAAEEQLGKSEELYRSLVEASPDIIMEIDLTGTILYVNRIIRGIRNEDAIGTNFLEYIPREEHVRVRKLLDRSMSRRRNTEFEVSVVTPVGTRWWNTRALPQERDGLLNRFLLITTDVTDTKRAQDALVISEERYRSLVEKAPIPIIVQRLGYFKYVNPKALEILGHKFADSLRGVHIKEFIHTDDRDRVDKQFPSNYRLDEPARKADFRLVRADGEVRVIVATGIIINFEGELSRMLMLDDVTEQKQAEQALRHSEERYRALVENSPLPVVIHRNGVYVYANMMVPELMGVDSVGEIIGKPMTDFIHPGDKDLVEREIHQTKNLGDKPSVLEIKIQHSDGEIRHIQSTAIVVEYEGELARLAILHDVTDEKKAVNALRQSEDQYRNLVENSPLPIIIHRDRTLVYANKKAAQLVGKDNMGEFVGKSFMDYLHPEDRVYLDANPIGAYSVNDAPRRLELRLQLQDGEIKNIVVSAITVNFEGELSRLIIMDDVTEKKRIDDTLRESEQQYRYLAENMRDAVFLMDMNFQHQYISPSIEQIRGFTVDDIFNLPIDQSLPPESLENVFKLYNYSIERGCMDENGEPLVHTFEQQEYCKDGSKVWTEVRASFVFDDDKNPVGIIGCTRDISDRKEREKVIDRQQGSMGQIIELNPYPIIILDSNGHLKSYNKAYYDLFQTTLEENYNYFEHPLVKELGVLELRERAKRGEVVQSPELEIDLRRVNPSCPDEKIFIKVTSFPVFDPDGNVMNYVLMYNNVTESRRAEWELRKTEERYREIVKNLPMGVLIYRGTQFIYNNETTAKILTGDEKADLSGRSTAEFIYEGDLEFVGKKVKQASENPDLVQKIRHRINTVNGVVWVEATATTVTESGQPARIIFFWEIDEPPEGAG